MKATITGNDKLSQRILVDLESGLRVSEVPVNYPVSLDQAKRLSRYNKMLKLAKNNLEEEFYNRLQLLGIKSLPLSSLFKQSDWGGIAEILSVTTEYTTRDELQLLIIGLEKKREQILELKEHTDFLLSQLEDMDKVLHSKEQELLQFQKILEEKFKIFKKYSDPFRSFLSEYLGVHEGELILAKRLSTVYQWDLEQQGMIEFNVTLQVYILKDFTAFVDSLISRHKIGLEYRWDPEKDITIIHKRTPWIEVQKDGRYKLISSYSESIIDAVKRINKELKDIRGNRLSIKDELNRIRDKTSHSYMEMTATSNILSTSDLKRQKELQSKALKWLFNHGFIAVADFTLPNGKTPSIFAYNESQIVIFDVKVSKEELIIDHKWIDCLDYCHDFYFLTPSILQYLVKKMINDTRCGHYVENGDSIKLLKPDERLIKIDQENELKFAASQLLSRKFIYGY